MRNFFNSAIAGISGDDLTPSSIPKRVRVGARPRSASIVGGTQIGVYGSGFRGHDEVAATRTNRRLVLAIDHLIERHNAQAAT